MPFSSLLPSSGCHVNKSSTTTTVTTTAALYREQRDSTWWWSPGYRSSRQGVVMETWDDKQTKWKYTGPQQTEKGLSDGSYHHFPWAIRGPLPSTLPPSPRSARMNSGISECRPRWTVQCVLLASFFPSAHLPSSQTRSRPTHLRGRERVPAPDPSAYREQDRKEGAVYR